MGTRIHNRINVIRGNCSPYTPYTFSKLLSGVKPAQNPASDANVSRALSSGPIPHCVFPLALFISPDFGLCPLIAIPSPEEISNAPPRSMAQTLPRILEVGFN